MFLLEKRQCILVQGWASEKPYLTFGKSRFFKPNYKKAA